MAGPARRIPVRRAWDPCDGHVCRAGGGSRPRPPGWPSSRAYSQPWRDAPRGGAGLARPETALRRCRPPRARLRRRLWLSRTARPLRRRHVPSVWAHGPMALLLGVLRRPVADISRGIATLSTARFILAPEHPGGGSGSAHSDPRGGSGRVLAPTPGFRPPAPGMPRYSRQPPARRRLLRHRCQRRHRGPNGTPQPCRVIAPAGSRTQCALARTCPRS